jgi:hypothetical protein
MAAQEAGVLADRCLWGGRRGGGSDSSLWGALLSGGDGFCEWEPSDLGCD